MPRRPHSSQDAHNGNSSGCMPCRLQSSQDAENSNSSGSTTTRRQRNRRSSVMRGSIATQRQRNARGHTLGFKLRDPPPGEKFKVECNKKGEPIGEEVAKDLITRLGIYARNGKFFNLTYKSWRLIPSTRKEDVWTIIQEKYEFDNPVKAKIWVIQSLAKKWRDFKCILKTGHYERHATDEERIRDRDSRVEPEQWEQLVHYWSTKEAKIASERNKANRAKLTMKHTHGTKSFARLQEEERKRRNDGSMPTWIDVFIRSHTRQDGSAVDPESQEIISKLRELPKPDPSQSNTSEYLDKLYQIFGKKRLQRLCGFDLDTYSEDASAPSDNVQSSQQTVEVMRENVELHERVKRLEAQVSRIPELEARVSHLVKLEARMTEFLRMWDQAAAQSTRDNEGVGTSGMCSVKIEKGSPGKVGTEKGPEKAVPSGI